MFPNNKILPADNSTIALLCGGAAFSASLPKLSAAAQSATKRYRYRQHHDILFEPLLTSSINTFASLCCWPAYEDDNSDETESASYQSVNISKPHLRHHYTG
jgi:hypothetical protein